MYNEKAMLEVKDLIKEFNKNRKTIAAVSLFTALTGLAVYFILPTRYIAAGSFYIQRAVEDAQAEFFTYEGYYGQQTAMSYTNTVAGLFESIDVSKKTLELQQKEINENNLRKLTRQINVRKEAPQLITLLVKEKSPEEAERLWTFISQSTLRTAEELNAEGDPLLRISPVGEFVVKKEFRSPYLNMGIGWGLGLILSLTVLSMRAYLKEEKNGL
jgi:capsular polysaccharide biosynthesis protein